jgi:hypothetical protein
MQSPVSFVVDMKAASAPAPETIKQRFEAEKAKPQLTREQLDQRLKHAAEVRAAAIEKQKHAASEVT